MNDLQKHTAKAIVNIFETGRLRGRYGAVTVLKGDSGHLSYGRSQATLGSGSLYLLLKDYCEAANAKFAAELVPLLPRFRNKDFALDNDRGVRDLLEDAGDDPVMQKTQDNFFDLGYWQPASRAAATCGLTKALSVAVVYDSHIHGGFRRIQKRVRGGPSVSPAVDESAWISSFIAERKSWLQSSASPLPNTIYRMNEFAKLIEQTKWELELPMTVRGVVINAEVLGVEDEPIVPARAPEPHTSSRILQLTRPFTRGDDVRALQTALRNLGFSGDVDGTFGPMTEVLVKQFQKQRNLPVDGIVGPMTWEELNEDASSAVGR
jgi:chitosanase